MLKNELKRAFTNSGMLLAIILGQGINLYYIIDYLISYWENKKCLAEVQTRIGQSLYMHISRNTPFDLWITGHINQITVLFLYFIPIIAALPYAASYAREKKSGYVKNVTIRVGRIRYRVYKMIASFLSGGCAAASVSIVNLMWCFTRISYKKPVITSSAPVAHGGTMFGVFYFSHPFIYVFTYILATFIFAGGISLLSMIVSEITDNIFTVILSPFLIIMVLNVVMIDNMQFYLPVQFLQASNSGLKLYMAPIFALIIIIISLWAVVFRNREKDVL